MYQNFMIRDFRPLFVLLLLGACETQESKETGPPTVVTSMMDCIPTANIVLSTATVAANGEDALTVEIDGECLANPTLVSSAGSLGPLVDDNEGGFYTTFVSSNIPGEAVLTFDANRLDPVSKIITMDVGEARGAELHLHGPISEGDQRHGWAVDQALLTGASVLWWTDHDYRYNFDLFNFIEEPDFVTSGSVLTSGFVPLKFNSPDFFEITNGSATQIVLQVDSLHTHKGDYSLRVSTSRGPSDSGVDTASVVWSADMQRLYRPLLAGVTLKFAILIPPDWDPELSSIRMVATFSKVDKSEERKIVFYSSDDEILAGPHEVLYPVKFVANQWTEVEIDLSEFAINNFDEGLDTTFRGLAFEFDTNTESTFTYNIGGLSVSEEICCEVLMETQRNYLQKNLSSEIQHFVGQEISFETSMDGHYLAFGTDVPLETYELYNLVDDPQQILGNYKANGALLAFAHPLVGADDNGGSVESFCEEQAKLDVYGMDMIEVTNENQSVPFSDYIKLWDCLAEKQFVLSGIAGSDTHNTLEWESSPHVVSFMTYPIVYGTEEDDYLEAINAGNAFIASYRGGFDEEVMMRVFSDDHRGNMGQILDNLPEEPMTIKVAVQGNKEGDILHWVVNGKLVESDKSAADEYSLVVTPTPWSWVRAELWRLDVFDDKPVMLTNPIYLSTEDIDVPEERTPIP
jgi:hypothetical protein